MLKPEENTDKGELTMKKLKMMIVAVVAALMLAGCTVSAPGFEVAGSVPSVTITALETMPATETKYEFGDLVYSLETWPDGTVHVCRHAVVAHVDGVVMVTTAIGATAEDIRWGLPIAFESWAEEPLGECIEQIDADMLYSSKEAAQAAADELMSGR
jgi:hypothetical protein